MRSETKGKQMSKAIRKQGEWRLYKIEGYENLCDLYLGIKGKDGVFVGNVSNSDEDSFQMAIFNAEEELRIEREELDSIMKAWKKAETEVKTTPVKLPEFIKEASQIHTENLANAILKGNNNK